MFKKFVKDRAHNRYPAYCCDDIDARVGAIEEALAALVAGTVPDGAVTLAKMANDARTYTREINKGTLICEWIGTEEEYNAHVAENGGNQLPNVKYTITDKKLGSVAHAETASGAPSAPENIEEGEVGKVFAFDNTNGFGLRNNVSKGLWRLWSFKDDADGKYYTALSPSYANKQLLGTDLRPIKRIFLRELGTESSRVKDAYMENANIKYLTDESGEDIYKKLKNAHSIYANLNAAENSGTLFDSTVSNILNTITIESGAGLYEIRLFFNTSGELGMLNYHAGLIRIPSGINMHTITSVRIANGDEYNLSFYRGSDDENYYLTADVNGGNSVTNITGSIEFFYRKISG